MIKFWKMHGVGNDFVVIDGRYDNIDACAYSKFAKNVCNRKFGIGADGLLIVKNSFYSDIKMVYYNADGSRGEMCGNGIRCFSRFIYENNIITSKKFNVETLDGIKEIEIIKDFNNKELLNVRVNMGKFNLNPNAIPVSTNKDKFIEEKVTILDREFLISSILMGVPHSVIFVDNNFTIDDVIKYGKLLEVHPIFPKKCNINFVNIINNNTIEVNTWERGCGYTLACGTGMTSSAIISNYLNKTNSEVKTISAGGELFIELEEDTTYMIGPATKVFEGILYNI